MTNILLVAILCVLLFGATAVTNSLIVVFWIGVACVLLGLVYIAVSETAAACVRGAGKFNSYLDAKGVEINIHVVDITAAFIVGLIIISFFF